jgi:two-component system, OmpR family, sensor kinase
MTKPAFGPLPSTFARRISLALAALAVVAALQGGLAVWAVGLVERHVERGRVAADIKQGFTEFWFDKQQLRGWLVQRHLGAPAADERRDQLLGGMRNTLVRLDGLAVRAVTLDDGPAARRSQAERRTTLAGLREGLERLDRAIADPDPPAPGFDAAAATRIADELLGYAGERAMRALLTDSLAREDAALEGKRSDTDDALALLRRLWIGTTGALALAALALAGGFARALRRPLLALVEGAAALRDGRLTHRIALVGAGEFDAVARGMNAMAEELAAHRAREFRARQALEEQVALRTAELTAALAARAEIEARRRRLFADISHELRTPTTAIRGEAQIALRGGIKPVEEYLLSLRRIEDAARQLGATIDDLLSMARSDIETLSMRRVRVDLAGVLDEVLSLGSAMARAGGVRFEGDVWPPALAVSGDADRLRQLLLVLVDNAVRYSRPEGLVRLTARRIEGDSPSVEVTISDNGIGIERTDLDKVFERGYRAPNASRHRSDGSGLGLSIARTLAEGHGGGVALASDPAAGTRATVTLPLIRTPDGDAT